MIYTLFFSRLRDLSPELEADYEHRSQALLQHVTEQHPGFVDIKSFVAEDGERLSVVRFRDEASQREWRLESGHMDAQSKGRSDFYQSYRVVICEELRGDEWEQADNTGDANSGEQRGDGR